MCQITFHLHRHVRRSPSQRPPFRTRSGLTTGCSSSRRGDVFQPSLWRQQDVRTFSAVFCERGVSDGTCERVWRHNQTSQRDLGNINISSQSCAEAEPGVFHGSSEHFLDVFVVFLQTVNQSINTELYIIYSSCVTLTPPARVVMVEAVSIQHR